LKVKSIKVVRMCVGGYNGMVIDIGMIAKDAQTRNEIVD
jgi:hypothetical protein